MHSGVWKKSADGNFQVSGKVLGIIGFGRIGKKLAMSAIALGMIVQYYDVIRIKPIHGTKPVSMEELLATSDFVSLHVPGSDSVIKLIKDRELSLMKKGSYLLNASRGYVVDIDSLVSHLKSGHLAGAAIDVFPSEPINNKDSFKTELANIPNVILTPHIGGSTEEAQKAVAFEVLDSVDIYFCQGNIINSANFPVIEPPLIEKNSIRLVNCHKNIPGVVKKINEFLSSYNITNIYCKSQGNVSYAIFDLEAVDKPLSEVSGIVEKMNNLPFVIWFRIISP